jgi:allantoicase
VEGVNVGDFTDRFDLASLRLGGAVIACDDDFFAEKENLLHLEAPVWKEHAYTDRGKWMDGWESRRKRTPGYTSGPGTPWFDWAIVRLGVPGIIRGVLVDTSFFRGNFPESCSIEACAAPTDASPEELMSDLTKWVEVLPRSPLDGDSKNKFEVTSPFAFTHVRLNIFPDGGVARLRVYGDVVPDWRRIGHARGEIDLAAAEHGGDVLLASDMFFGERRNLIMPGRAVNMSDGWETRRRRGPGSDWAIIRLGAPGSIARVEIDTNHFIGNFPDTCRLEACFAPDMTDDELARAKWTELLPLVKLSAHTRHRFEDELAELGEVTHLRINVYPDGGVSRLRVFGTLSDETRKQIGVKRLDTLPPFEAAQDLKACSSAPTWIQTMLDLRPFQTSARVLQAAEEAWSKTGPEDWRAAIASHPRIGERHTKEARDDREKRWSQGEQRAAASPEHQKRLAEINTRYEAKFGFTYIVCATGKSAEELIAIADERLENDPKTELEVCAGELLAIAKLRLEKLIEP